MRCERARMCLNLDRKFPNLKIKRSLNPDKEFVINLFKMKHLKRFATFLPFNHYSEPCFEDFGASLDTHELAKRRAEAFFMT